MGELDLRRSVIASLLLSSSSLLGAAPALAEEGLVFEPGQWKFDISVRMPMQREASHQSDQFCIVSDPVGPSALMPWADEQGCKIKGVEVEQNKLTWKLVCRMDGQIARGKGEFESAGGHAKGKARIDFEAGGQRLSIRTEWDGERMGECPPDVSGAVDSPAESAPKQ